MVPDPVPGACGTYGGAVRRGVSFWDGRRLGSGMGLVMDGGGG